jgi:hypothetical protein
MTMRIQGPTPATPPINKTADASGAPGAELRVPAINRTDAVRISEAGRALAEAALPVRPDPSLPLTSDQLERIRDRIRDGSYDTMAVISAVTSRILASGDLSAAGTAEE